MFLTLLLAKKSTLLITLTSQKNFEGESKITSSLCLFGRENPQVYISR